MDHITEYKELLVLSPIPDLSTSGEMDFHKEFFGFGFGYSEKENENDFFVFCIVRENCVLEFYRV